MVTWPACCEGFRFHETKYRICQFNLKDALETVPFPSLPSWFVRQGAWRFGFCVARPTLGAHKLGVGQHRVYYGEFAF